MSPVLSDRALQIVLAFQMLDDLGYRIVDTGTTKSELLGNVTHVKWESPRAARRVSVIFAEATSTRPSALSLLIENGAASFTYTDWYRSKDEQFAIEATDFITAPDIESGLLRYASSVKRSIAQGLGDILLGTAWSSIPTYRGVNG